MSDGVTQTLIGGGFAVVCAFIGYLTYTTNVNTEMPKS